MIKKLLIILFLILAFTIPRARGDSIVYGGFIPTISSSTNNGLLCWSGTYGNTVKDCSGSPTVDGSGNFVAAGFRATGATATRGAYFNSDKVITSAAAQTTGYLEKWSTTGAVDSSFNQDASNNLVVPGLRNTGLTASLPVEPNSDRVLVSGTQTGTGAYVKQQSPSILDASTNTVQINSATASKVAVLDTSKNVTSGTNTDAELAATVTKVGSASANWDVAYTHKTSEDVINGLVAVNGSAVYTGVSTSAQLAAVLSDETGTGKVVYDTSPTITNAQLTTPNIGAATGTSVSVSGDVSGGSITTSGQVSGASANFTTSMLLPGGGAMSAAGLGIGTTGPVSLLSLNDAGNNQSAQLSVGVSGTQTHSLGRNSATGIFEFKGLTNNNGFNFVNGAPAVNGSIFAVNTSQLMVNGDTGNVGIGTTGPTVAVDVNGSIRTRALGAVELATDANGVIQASVSDERFKKNIMPIADTVDVVGLLNRATIKSIFYNWQDGPLYPAKRTSRMVGMVEQESIVPATGHMPTTQQIGFTAQMFEDIPGMVVTDADGIKSLNYSKITAILWEQNRALLKRVEALEAR